jgi:hypothetical protein
MPVFAGDDVSGPFYQYKKQIIGGGETEMTTETKKEHAGEKPLEKMTVKELKAIALEIPRTAAVHDMKKDDLIKLIKEHRGIKDEEVKKKVKKEFIKVVQTKEQIKAKIRELKKAQLEARQKRVDDQSCSLRKRISRLKKRTRKMAMGG